MHYEQNGAKSEKKCFWLIFGPFLTFIELFRSSFFIFLIDMSWDIPKLIVCMHCEQKKVKSDKNCFWLIFGSFLAFTELKWAIWELIFNFCIKYTLWHIKIDSLPALSIKWDKNWKKIKSAHFLLIWAQLSKLVSSVKFLASHIGCDISKLIVCLH